jgi:hypothetical protein
MGVINYTLIRKIHLYTAFTLLGFVAMYFITGFVLSHEQWFADTPPVVTTQPCSIKLPEAMSLEDLSVYLQDTLAIRAKRMKPKLKKDGSLAFEYVKPGRIYRLNVSPDRTSAVLQLEKLNGYRTFTAFHRLHGYGGGWLYDLYVLMMDLASIALILFSLTGIYLWYQLMKRKTWGFLLLALSLAYTTLVNYLFMNNL